MAPQIRTTYIEFEIKNLSLEQTEKNSGYIHNRKNEAYKFSTVANHLGDCILAGLDVNWLIECQ